MFVQRYGEMLARELLAESVTAGDISSPDHAEPLDVDGADLIVAIRRA